MWCRSHLWVELKNAPLIYRDWCSYCVAAGMDMSIKVRYFASLGERFGRSESNLEFKHAMTVCEVWQQDTSGLPMPDNVLAAINMDYALPEDSVQDGDEVAFFPPVTGG
jgi:molybdopterin synthase sulfur carrier subunit